jgi:hypothetical protein
MSRSFSDNSDYSRDFIWLLFDMEGFPLPPYLLEVVLIDGRSFYIHSPNQRDETSKSIILNVYDFRAIGDEEDIEIKSKLDAMGTWDPKVEPRDLHLGLSAGRLRCNLEDIAYCVEWWTRYWTLEEFVPKEERRKLGFQLGEAE